MKLDEYKTKLTGVVDKPDTAPAVIAEVIDALTDDLNTIDSLTATITERDNTINTLRDTNTRLFLAKTGKGEELKPEETREEAKEKMINKLLGKE